MVMPCPLLREGSEDQDHAVFPVRHYTKVLLSKSSCQVQNANTEASSMKAAQNSIITTQTEL